MMHLRSPITLGFLIAGCVNFFGSLLVSAGFTNQLLRSLDPVVFSNFGLIAIMLWGLAYAAVARSYQHVPYLVMVFTLEKFVYAIIWIVWMSRFSDRLRSVLSDAPVTGIFFYTYGIVDFLFGVFFAWVAVTTFRQRASS